MCGIYFKSCLDCCVALIRTDSPRKDLGGAMLESCQRRGTGADHGSFTAQEIKAAMAASKRS